MQTSFVVPPLGDIAPVNFRPKPTRPTTRAGRAPTLEKLKEEVKAFVDQLGGKDDDDLILDLIFHHAF